MAFAPPTRLEIRSPRRLSGRGKKLCKMVSQKFLGITRERGHVKMWLQNYVQKWEKNYLHATVSKKTEAVFIQRRKERGSKRFVRGYSVKVLEHCLTVFMYVQIICLVVRCLGSSWQRPGKAYRSSRWKPRHPTPFSPRHHSRSHNARSPPPTRMAS